MDSFRAGIRLGRSLGENALSPPAWACESLEDRKLSTSAESWAVADTVRPSGVGVLAAENKVPGTIRIYTEAPLWFAAAYLLRETDKSRWEQVDAQDVRRWLTWLLGGYSEAYARQQYRSLRQFFLWLADGEEIPDPTARLRAPAVKEKPVPFFSSVELSRLEKACRGNTFAQRRDAAIFSAFRATGIRLAGLAAALKPEGRPRTMRGTTRNYSGGEAASIFP